MIINFHKCILRNYLSKINKCILRNSTIPLLKQLKPLNFKTQVILMFFRFKVQQTDPVTKLAKFDTKKIF